MSQPSAVVASASPRITGLMFDCVGRKPLYAVLRTARQMSNSTLTASSEPFDALFDKMVAKEPPDLVAFKKLCHGKLSDLVLSSSNPQQIIFDMPNIHIAVVHNSHNGGWKMILKKFETPAMGALYLASLTDIPDAHNLYIHFTANDTPGKALLKDVIARLNAVA